MEPDDLALPAQLALDLLLATDQTKARELAASLDEINRERQRIQERVWSEAVTAAEAFADEPALVLGAEGWHQGVVGIVAAKLVDKFRKPVVPGDQLRIEVTPLRRGKSIWKFRGEAKVEGTLVCEAEFLATITKK